MTLRNAALPLVVVLALAGCKRSGEIEIDGGVGITAVRSACPSVGIAAGTGDITLFDPVTSRDANAITVTAAITNVRPVCNDAGTDIVTAISFDVLARRTRSDSAQSFTMPYFVTVVRGGSAVTAKRVGQVTVSFAAGQDRATTSATGTAVIDRAAATLPADVIEKLTRKRKAGDQDAAIDPLTDPAIRQAVQAASFEALVGFQLTDEQLKYNLTR